MEHDIGQYRVRFSIEASLANGEDEFEHVLQRIDGKIVFVGDDQREEIVGEVRGWRVLAGWHYDEAMDACDAIDGELVSYMNAIVDPETGFARDEVEDLIEDASNGVDTLIVELVKVGDGHRGIGVGLLAAMRFVQTFGAGCGYAIGKAFPLQFASLETIEMNATQKTAFRKLREHWGRIGFKRLGKNSNYMAINLDHLQPSIEEAMQSYEKRKSAS
jgi:hypothetical protein